MEKKYFHKLSEEEFNNAIKERKEYKDFKQPKWCGYPNALDPMFGCWSLTKRTIKIMTDCQSCKCFINKI